jgi:hypothetical protein
MIKHYCSMEDGSAFIHSTCELQVCAIENFTSPLNYFRKALHVLLLKQVKKWKALLKHQGSVYQSKNYVPLLPSNNETPPHGMQKFIFVATFLIYLLHLFYPFNFNFPFILGLSSFLLHILSSVFSSLFSYFSLKMTSTGISFPTQGRGIFQYIPYNRVNHSS